MGRCCTGGGYGGDYGGYGGGAVAPAGMTMVPMMLPSGQVRQFMQAKTDKDPQTTFSVKVISVKLMLHRSGVMFRQSRVSTDARYRSWQAFLQIPKLIHSTVVGLTVVVINICRAGRLCPAERGRRWRRFWRRWWRPRALTRLRRRPWCVCRIVCQLL